MEAPKEDFLIYDGDCGFCKFSIDFLEKLIGDRIKYIPSYKLQANFYNLDQESFDTSIKFFEHKTHSEQERPFYFLDKYIDFHEDASIYHGALAIFQALATKKLFAFFLCFYRFLPGFAHLSEAVYSLIAKNRITISKMIGVQECKIN